MVIMRQTACLVVNPIIVDGYASLFNCTTAVRASDSMTASLQNFNQWVSFTLAYSRISHEYSSLFIIVINLIFMFSLWCIEFGAFMRTEFLCISVLRVASGPRVKLVSCKSALNPPPPVVYSTGRSKAVVPVLVLLFVALWFILWGDLLYVFPCAILFLCFLVLRLLRLGKRELILVLFVRLFGLCLFRFVGFLFLLGSGMSCGLWLWHSLDFSLTFCDCGTPWTFLLPLLKLIPQLMTTLQHTF